MTRKAHVMSPWKPKGAPWEENARKRKENLRKTYGKPKET